MSSIRQKVKVTPQELPGQKKNNFITNALHSITGQLKYLIVFETILGINRVYLLKNNKFLLRFTNVYCSLFFCLIVYFSVSSSHASSSSHFVLKYTVIFEFVLLVCFATFVHRQKLIKFFNCISSFDETLNINNDLSITSSSDIALMWILGCVLYNAMEFVLIVYMGGTLDAYATFDIVITLAHDIEQIYYFTLLRYIFMRLRIVKAHVYKVYGTDKDVTDRKEINKVEELSKKVQLDISSLHNIYDKLHKCADQLNLIMSFPMLIMLFTSALSTTLLLKIYVREIQTSNEKTNFSKTWTMICLLMPCVKYTILVIIPCYYSSITNTQASTIRTILHDAVNTMELEKTERRKVKTFFQLTREKQFTYAICGVIRLNMSLPLSYSSLCTTYLVIIIQFSKFID